MKGVHAGRMSRMANHITGYKFMATGTVKFFNTTRGFGFISPEDGSKDVFVHISAVEQSGMTTLNEGQKVNFDVEPDARGPKAANLQEA